MTELQENKYYEMKIKHYGRELSYKGQILWIRENRFKIQTDEDTKLVFNTKQIFFLKEIQEKDLGRAAYIPLKVGKQPRTPRKLLKEPVEPKGLRD